MQSPLPQDESANTLGIEQSPPLDLENKSFIGRNNSHNEFLPPKMGLPEEKEEESKNYLPERDDNIPFDMGNAIVFDTSIMQNAFNHLFQMANSNKDYFAAFLKENSMLKTRVEQLEKHHTFEEGRLNMLRGDHDNFQNTANDHFKDLSKVNEKTNTRLKKLEDKVNDFEDKFILLENAPDGAGADLKQVEIMVHKLRKEFRDSFLQDEDLDVIREQIAKHEEILTKHTLTNEETDDRIKQVTAHVHRKAENKMVKDEIIKMRKAIEELSKRPMAKGDGSVQV